MRERIEHTEHRGPAGRGGEAGARFADRRPAAAGPEWRAADSQPTGQVPVVPVVATAGVLGAPTEGDGEP